MLTSALFGSLSALSKTSRKLVYIGACLAAGGAGAQTSATLQHRYSFDTDAHDSIGGAHGQLAGGATISGGAVVLDGVSGYVNLPNNLVTGYTSVTIETWVTDNGSSAWGRIYDFGNSTGGEDFPLGSATQGTQYMFLTSRSGTGTLRGSYTVGGGGSAEQVVEWPGTALPTGVLKHVVWASDGDAQTAWLYVDGVLVGSNTAVTITPASLGPTVNDWIGRSQYDDPLFKGTISEFRIYDGALSPLQIAINLAAGPDRVVSDPGTLQSVTLQVAPTMALGTTQTSVLLGNFANVTNLNLSAAPGAQFSSSDTNIVIVDPSGRITAVGMGMASVTATYAGVSDTEAIQVSAPAQTLVHRYSFTTDASDSVGGANGALAGGAVISGGAVVLNGSTAYVDLPNNLVTGLVSVTFEAWFTDNGSSGWARVWDLGNSIGGEGNQGGGTSYMFLSVPSGAGGVRGAYELPGTGEQIVDYGARPTIGARHHVVWAQDGLGQTAKLYLDGALVAQNDSFTYTPAAVGDTVNDWLGRSQYNDPYFYGSIDEFRVYAAALTAAEVALNYQAGPDVSPQSGPVTIMVQPQNATVAEQQPATFTVGYIGHPPVNLQWLRGGVPIPGATNASYRLAVPRPLDSGTVFRVALTNSVANVTFSILSSNAVLTVLPDTTPPTILRTATAYGTNVQLVFSEPLEAASATNGSNYVFTNGLVIASATLSADGATVTLGVPPLSYGSNYVLVVNGVRDRATTPNSIAPNTTVSFVVLAYNMVDLGGSTPAGVLTGAGNSYDLVAGGAGLGGTSDQCQFSYQSVSGNFDLQVRLQGLGSLDEWAKAGLMARETLDPGSRFAAAIATPNLQGSFFEYRAALGAQAASAGSFPPNFPNGWLRLQRAGNQFTGYASYDGQTWVQLGSVSLSLPATLYVGLVLASHVNGAAVTAQFRDVGNAATTLVSAVSNPSERLGPSSRRTPIAISEIMYQPADRADGRNAEFIEFFNSNPWPQDMSGYRVDGQVQFTFPAHTTIPGGGFVVLAAAPADLAAVYGLSGVMGPYLSSLKTSGALQLYDEAGALLLDLHYSNNAPWPMGADGTGHSIVLARPSYGEADPRAWDRSDAAGGSPGAFEAYRPSPLRNVVLNEILAHTNPPDLAALELYNHSNSSVDLSGCILSDDPALAKFTIPSNTLIAPRGFFFFTATQLGFALNAAGGTIYFKNPGGSRVLDALRFDAQQNGVSLGRYPDGASQWYRLSAQTFGAKNAAPLASRVGINEIMYHPLAGLVDDQYVELYNQGPTAANLSGWKFTAGITFAFPSNTVMAPNGYQVVAANVSRLLTHYPQLNLTNTVGNFQGRLSGAGERLALTMPDAIVSTNAAGNPVTNYLDVVVDEVTYGTGGRWGQWSDGGGSSLELIDARADKRLAANWADSDESLKAPWTNIEATGVLDNGANYIATLSYAQVGLLDAGECLVDNLEVRPGVSGANYVTNPGFDQGLAGWSVQGDHSRSTVEPNAGYPAGGNALHLRTGDKMWSGANAAQVVLTNGLAVGQTATLRLKARWLKGWPEVVLRLNGNWLEATGRLPVPANLGTPGLPNSRAVTNAGPAIYAVTHSPSLPAAGQPVVITARVADPDGVASFKVRYRVDPATSYTDLPLVDDGTGGDAVASDGLYSAVIPGQASGVVVAFIVVATDAAGASSRFPALLQDNSPDCECVVMFGDPNPASSFGAYHLWLTQTNVNRWVALPVLSNEDIDGTLVSDSRVIYNLGARYAGSPYHQAFDSPCHNACHYNWKVPKDDLFLGSASFNEIHWPGNDVQQDTPTQNINDATLQRGQAANLFLRALGAPWINRRFVTVYVNGCRRGALMEDALRPSVSVGKEYFSQDTGGILYKVQPWFEFDAFPSGNYMPWNNMAWADLLPHTTTGGAYKPARYRWNYEVRQTPDSMSNFTNLFTLEGAAAAYSLAGYVPALQNLADVENWMRVMAANHAAGNWDCWGVQNGQNLYAYLSPQVRWTLFMFDFDIALGNPISWPPGANLFTGSDSTWQQIYNNPAFGRIYLRALKELVNGIMMPAAINPILDAKYAAFVADGLSVQTPTAIESWVASARTSIAAQVAAKDAGSFKLNSTNLTAVSAAATLTGAAPVEVTTISVNGETFTPLWNTVTGWTLSVPAPFGTNTWTVLAYDRFGNLVGGTNYVRISNLAVPDPPAGTVVFSEIMYHPVVPGAEYVELFNRSTTTTFDLAGWRVDELGYTFPPGSTLAPRKYLVLAKSGVVQAATYGALTPVFDEFDGTLSADGDTLSLIEPGTGLAPDVVVDRVRYEPNAPWPAAAAAQSGTSLQVIDAGQDNSRAGDWAAGAANPVVTPQWVYVWTNLTATSSRLFIYLTNAGDLYLDDLKLVPGTVPDAGPNLVRNGDFESPLGADWTLAGNFTSSAISGSIKHWGTGSLHVVASGGGGTGSGNAIYQDLNPPLTNGATYTLSFWYLQTSNGPLVLRLSGATACPILNPAPPAPVAAAAFTPGLLNSVSATLPAFPSLWLNELQAENVTGAVDNFGEHGPWLELFNPGANPVSLAGYYLGTNYASPTLWAFPPAAGISPGQFLVVWADGQPQRAAGSVLHTCFRLSPGAGSLVLSRFIGNALQVVDYLNYSSLPPDYSYGDVPDGQPFYRQPMPWATPGGTNTTASPPITVTINEWMAQNTSYLPDPATGKYDDWFELYNPAGTPAELAGYYLTDALTNQFQYRIPAGYYVPAHGFLLVWADGKPTANSTNSPDLHVSFKLAKAGGAIGLFAADGTAIDALTFGPQTANVSEGRYPDGGSLRLFLPTPSPGAPNILPPASAPPAITGFSLLPGNAVALTFQTALGHTYRVEFKNALTAPLWLPLGADLFATSPTLTVNDTSLPGPQRFYRIVMVQ